MHFVCFGYLSFEPRFFYVSLAVLELYTDLKLRDPSASASPVLGLKVRPCTTTIQLRNVGLPQDLTVEL